MKNLFYIFILFTGICKAQIVIIPDANFKAKLLTSNTFNNIAYGNGGYLKIDQNDDGEIQEVEALVIDSLNVPFSSIEDFSGISSFVNLKKIDCSNNQINNLNVSSLSLLQELYCSNNCMGTLAVNGLSNLKILDANTICVSNFNLTGLTSLEYLSCKYNGLSLLDVSQSTSLKVLNCGYNNLVSLTISGFPDLEQLICESNQLMTSLTISSLPSLSFLDVTLTNIGSLDLTSFTSLTSVVCTLANLNTLQVSNLPNLTSLLCALNSLANLDLGSLPQLQVLQCGGNPFTTLDLSETPNINSIECSSSFVSYIDLSGLTNLNSFSSYSGQFESLDFSSNPNLSLLILNTNTQLRSLFLKNGTIQYFNGNGLTECTNLEYICVDENEISQIQSFINASNLTNVNVGTYCSFTPGGDFNTIVGSIQYDTDGNGCDVNDGGFPNVRVNITDGTQQGATFSNVNGGYIFNTLTGTYNLQIATENPSWFTISPATAPVNFPDANNNQSIQNFCITPNGVHPDLEIIIAPLLSARPGFLASYSIVIKNKGNQTITQANDGISFTYDHNRMSLVETSEPVSLISAPPGTLNWDVLNLMPFESRSITLVMNVNPPTHPTFPVNIGDIFNFTATANPVETDETPSDNTFQFNQTVIGAYDPNEIVCVEGNLVSPTEIGNYLHYVINFENTGNAEAENIVVREVIDVNQFDVSTLQLLDSSAAVTTRLTGNVVEFIFSGINLEAGGHGNILLKMKTNTTLVEGDSVSKKVNIYFDYNFPVETLPENTLFQALSNPDMGIDASISVYPNPSKGRVNINCASTIKSVQMYDIQGRLLQTSLVNKNQTDFDISNQSSGVYFLKVISENGIGVKKIVKE